MVSRIRGRLAASAVLVTLALGAASCERVPLLAPTGSTITLTSTASALPFNGSADIIAQVIEASGTPPHSGTKISFSTNLGTFQPPDAQTDIAGRVVVKFLAGTTSGTASIIALSGGVNTAPGSGQNASAGSVLKIAVGAAAVASVVMNASPSVVSASGGTSTITAKVADAGGNPLPGISVAFSTDAGSLSSTVATSDAAGSASVTLTTNRTAKVTGTAGVAAASGSATTAAPSSTVTVSANATSTVTVGTATPSPAIAGLNVSFPLTYTTSAGGSLVSRLSVDWGDGRSQSYSGQPASIAHSFATAGSYLVVVTATDSFGDSSSASAAVTVSPRPQVTVTIAYTAATATFALTESATTGNFITSVAIDFGDGTSVQLSGPVLSVAHAYIAAGTYTATAVATDSSGATGSASTVFSVSGGASFTAPSTAAKNTVVSFDASASLPLGQIVTYAWDFGDGSGASGSSSTQTHPFSLAGTYNVRLTITDTSGRTSTLVKQITIT